jgi:hypothetical protein
VHGGAGRRRPLQDRLNATITDVVNAAPCSSSLHRHGQLSSRGWSRNTSASSEFSISTTRRTCSSPASSRLHQLGTWRASQGETSSSQIAGLSAIDRRSGAAEMGKPVLYIPCIYDMDDIQTISSMSILSHIAKTTAEYETPILVPCTRSLVMSTAFEVVKEAYIQAGKADAFQGDNIRYLTDDQFVRRRRDGIMMPAANFYSASSSPSRSSWTGPRSARSVRCTIRSSPPAITPDRRGTSPRRLSPLPCAREHQGAGHEQVH